MKLQITHILLKLPILIRSISCPFPKSYINIGFQKSDSTSESSNHFPSELMELGTKLHRRAVTAIENKIEAHLGPVCSGGRIQLSRGDNNGESCYANGAVSTEVPLCSSLGVDILRKGGNAMDAAVASSICVGIINSFSSGIGGGGFLLLRKPASKNNREIVDSIDFREISPGMISKSQFSKGSDKTKRGGMSVGVPGEIRGLLYAHRKYGKLPWKQLFKENIKIAKKFKVSKQLAKRLKKLEIHILNDRGLREIYTRNGQLVKEGDYISRSNYAETLKKIAEDPESFYRGDIAEKIVSSIQENGGVLTLEDLQNYKPVWRKPLKGKYRDYTLYTTNLPSSGLFIIEAMNILERYDLKELEKVGRENGTFPHYHLLVEIYKFIAARRGEFADPDFIPNWKSLVAQITSKKYAEKIVEKIDFNHSLSDIEYGFKMPFTEDHGTTHLNVIDENEMSVLITSTVNLEFGSKFMDPKTGIIFNDEMDDFYVPEVQNAFDLGAMPSNILEPRKRPFSSASPVLLVKFNEILAVGAAGGTRIPTSIIAVMFHLILGKSLEEAIMESRIHHQLIPAFTYVENNFPHDIRNYLKRLGHKVEVSTQNSIFTSVQGIHLIKTKNGDKIIQAFSDSRKGGKSDGY
ncbi:Glutathione hydrolase proenzyme 2 [Astathelohania contejeani]|uniref:Glutathione hydrolase n=1 Tax=Astathelohania contejeani TaxID=164912 RepID=A0ABQ7HYD8_9MICR|nr:Glutathione hydrolase proenzyme 2 [Thelohania contejeani]